METSALTPGIDEEGIPLETLLREDAEGISLFQAIRLLEELRPWREVVGGFGDPSDEVVRFSVPPTLAFPPGEVASLDLDAEGPALMGVHAFGLTGSHGVLPAVYTQFAQERVRDRDPAMRDFLDLFHHRLISLLYRAWRKYRFALALGQGEEDLLTRHLRELVGIGLPGDQEHPAADPDALVFHAGLLAPATRGPVALEQLLADHFEVPVEVIPFAGGWYRIDRSDLTHVGEDTRSTVLGGGAVIGGEVWDPSARIRVRIGPLTRARYDDFLPGGRAWEPLRSLVRFHTHDSVDVEVNPVLHRNEVGGIRLGVGRTTLSWGTWISTVPPDRDPDDTVFLL